MKKFLFLNIVLSTYFLSNIVSAQCTTGCTHVCYQGDVSSPLYVTTGNTWTYSFNLKNVGTSLVCSSPNVTCTATNYRVAIYSVTKDGSTTWTYPSSCPYVTLVSNPPFTIAPLITSTVSIGLQFSVPGTYYIQFDILYTDGTRTCVPTGWIRVYNTVNVVQWSVSPPTQSVIAAGGPYSATVYSTPGGLTYNLSLPDSWIHFVSYPGGGAFNYTVDNNTSTSSRTGHIYVNDVSHGFSDATTLTITQNGAPATYVTSSFGASPGCQGQYTYFSDYSYGSPGPISWSWNFGDGYTSTLENPSHIYSTSGSKSVSLTVNNSTGNNSTSTQVITIPNAIVSASFTQSLGYSGASSSFTDISSYSCGSYGTSWTWSFGDGSPNSLIHNPSHVYTSSGTYPVSLTACNNLGSCNTSTHNVTIIPPPVTFSYTVTTIPAWQRAGDDFTISINATTSDGSNWRLVAHDPTGANPDHSSSLMLSGVLFSFPLNFRYPTSNVQYYLQNTSLINSPILVNSLSTPYQTQIIDSQWVNKNYVYNNSPGQTLNIPLKNIPGATSVSYNFSRVSGTSSMSDIIPSGTMSLVSGSNQYLIIPYATLHNLNPGVFTCNVTYYGTSTYTETDVFDLTKIGELNSSSTSNKVVIFVAGILNTNESDIQALQTDLIGTAETTSVVKFSLASYLSQNGFDCWYIGQSNTNYIVNNSFDIGIALEKIHQLKPLATEIDFVCHSKGGLEVRALLADPSLTKSLSGTSSFNFNNFQTLNSTIVKKVLFLDVPHRGASADLFVKFLVKASSLFTQSYTSLSNTPGVKDLLEHNRIVDIINTKNLPISIKYANVTGYSNYNGLNDGAVDLTESTLGFDPASMAPLISLFGGSNNIYQLYQNDTRFFEPIYYLFDDLPFTEILHTNIHTNNILSNPGGYGFIEGGFHNYTPLNCNEGTNNLYKIYAFLNTNIADFPPFASCNTHFIETILGTMISSKLSGAKVFYKVNGDSLFHFIGKSDESGTIIFRMFGGIMIGDSIKLEASGKETVTFSVDSNILATNKFNITMLSTLSSSLEIKYPELQLINQNYVTSSNSIDIKATGQNVLSCEINYPFNQDTNFVPLSLVDSIFTANLDTGYNHIIVKFIGSVNIDTLDKEVYFFPSNLINQNLYKIYLLCDSLCLGTNIYVKSHFVKQISSIVDSITVSTGSNTLKFSKNGYVDSLLTVDSSTTISISSHIFPNSYSSLTDSNIFDFTAGHSTQYWKTITIRDTSFHSIVSVKQYDDNFTGLGLLSVSRKLEFRLLNPPFWANYTLGISIDQTSVFPKDSIYLLKKSSDTLYTKTTFDTSVNAPTYDSEVMKLIINNFNFNRGTTTLQSFALMQKQPPIVFALDTIVIYENDSILLPITAFFGNPDSIKHDILFQFIDSTPSGLILTHRSDSVYIHTVPCFSGITSFSLNGTHDWLTKRNIVYVKVIPTPHPVISSSGDSTFCSGNSDTLYALSGISYQWLNFDTPILGATDTNFIVTTTGNYSAIITRGVCPDTSNIIRIIVKALPVLSPIVSQSKCDSNLSDSVNFISSLSGTTCNWTNDHSSIGIPDSGTGNIASFNVINDGYSPVIATFSVTPLADGCVGVVQSFNITVNPIPNVSVPSNQTICGGNLSSSISLTGSVSGTIFIWTNSNTSIGLVASDSNFIPEFTATNGSYIPISSLIRIIPSANGCTGLADSFNIVVNPKPVLSSPLSLTPICDSLEFYYNPIDSISGTSFSWTRSIILGISNPVASGINSINEILINSSPYSIPVVYEYVLSASGCTDTQYVSVTVNPKPSLTSTHTPSAICDSTVFDYNPTSVTPGTVFRWSRAVVSGISNPDADSVGNPHEVLINTTPNPVVVNYVDTLIANGCFNVQTIRVTVNPKPLLTSPLTLSAICDSNLFIYAPESLTTGTNYYWSRNPIAGITNPAATGLDSINERLINSTPNQVVVIYFDSLVANGCSNVENVTVTVNPKPILTSTLTPSAICDSTTFSYIPASATPGTTFTWSRAGFVGISNPGSAGIGNPLETLINLTPNPIVVIYVDTLRAYGCSNTQNISVTVNPKPTLSSPLTLPAVCDSNLIHYIPTSITTGTTFSWVRLTISGISNPLASGVDSINEVLWNSTPNPIVVTYADSLKANGCGNVQNVTVTVNPKPLLTSTLIPPSICDSAFFNYTPTSATTGTVFIWSRASETGILNPSANGINSIHESLINSTTDQITVTYIDTLKANNCKNFEKIIVTVNPTPHLTSKDTASICSGMQFNYSQACSIPGTTYTWLRQGVSGISPATSIGSGDISETMTNATLSPINVIYIDTLTAYGCSNFYPIKLIVNPVPDAPHITTEPPSSLCFNTQYQNFGTNIPAQAGVAYTWTASNATIWAQGSGKQYCLISFFTPGATAVITLSANVPGFNCFIKDTFAVTAGLDGSNVSETPNVIYTSPEFICLSALEDSYQWGYDDALTLDSNILPGEINQNYRNPNPDFLNKYYWVITTHNGCMQKSYENVPTGISGVNPINNAMVEIFPNPTDNIVNVSVSNSLTGNIEIMAFDQYGKKLLSVVAINHKAKIELGRYASGSYLIVCFQDGIKIASKIVIKN